MKSGYTQKRILDEVRKKFAARHKLFGRKAHGGHPESLKRLAVSAVLNGIACSSVAEAAGVSGPSIGNWCKELGPSLLPQELKLIEDENVSVGPTMRGGPSEAAIIYLQSGVRIEVPVAALTAQLIHELREVSA